MSSRKLLFHINIQMFDQYTEMLLTLNLNKFKDS